MQIPRDGCENQGCVLRQSLGKTRDLCRAWVVALRAAGQPRAAVPTWDDVESHVWQKPPDVGHPRDVCHPRNVAPSCLGKMNDY